MFFLRVVGNHKSYAPESFNAEKAHRGLMPRPGESTSVFQVGDDSAIAVRIAGIFSMGARDRPEAIDYVLVPDEWLVAINLQPIQTRCDIDHPLLHSTHHELPGLDSEGMCEALASRFLFRGELGTRISRSRLIEIAKNELQTPDWADHARRLIEGKPGWEQAVN